MKIPERIIWGVENSAELLRHHPLLIWDLLRRRDGRRGLLEIVGGANIAFHTTGDGWRDIKENFKSKLWHRSTK